MNRDDAPEEEYEFTEDDIPDAQREDDDEQEELAALGKIAHAFVQYKIDSEWEVKRWEYNYSRYDIISQNPTIARPSSLIPFFDLLLRLSPSHQQLLSHIPIKVATARHCIYQNHLFIKSMLDWLQTAPTAPAPLCFASATAAAWAAEHGPAVNPEDADKVRYVLKNAMRDWSAEGAAEREESYGAITAVLQTLFSTKPSQQQHHHEIEIDPPRVLVPGCGLGRLCAELCSLGFHALGNEHSYYMLIASTYFLMCDTLRAEQWPIFPWLYTNSNHVTDADQLRPIHVPDVLPSSLINRTSLPGLLGMAAGEFVEVFNTEEFSESFDAVATCFFIDTTHNVLDYMTTIYNCLKPGGYWVNLGPLQWHWENHPGDELSVELSLDDVQSAAQRLGFVFLRKEVGKKCRYMCDDRSMLHQQYDCAFWTAQKT